MSGTTIDGRGPVPTASEHFLGSHGEPGRGPLVVVTAALHGNEPTGVEAAERILRTLRDQRPRFRGELLVAIGNPPALEAGVRFLDRDLNRLWDRERVEALRRGDPSVSPTSEDAQMLGLLDLVEPRIDRALRAGRRVFHVDLHTSSADGCPFVTCGDTLRNRAFATGIPAPLILGLEEQIDGSLIEFLGDKGVVTLASEAGQHDLPSSVDHHESVLWFALVQAGCISRRAVHDLDSHEAGLRRASAGIDRIIEVHHRHRIRPEDRFRMEPGYVNFQRVYEGDLLARDVRGEIHADADGVVLLPLYQGLGEDGFFFGRRVRGWWLKLSWLVRRLRLTPLLARVPGARSEPVAGRIAFSVPLEERRALPLETLYLLGFRKIRERDGRVIVSRRRWDLSAPW